MTVLKFSQNADINYSLALEKIKEQDYLFAIRLLKEAIELSPKTEYYVELAELYYKLGFYEESTAVYIELSKIDFSMEVAFAVLHSHQKSLNVSLDAEQLHITTGAYFKISNKRIDNVKLDNIIKEYQNKYLREQKNGNFELVDLKQKRNEKLLEDAKILLNKRDYTNALITLDSVDVGYEAQALELKMLMYFKAEDYIECVKTSLQYDKLIKGNITISRCALYSMYCINGKRLNKEFKNEFTRFLNDAFKSKNVYSVTGLYHLAFIVGYFDVLKYLIDRMMKEFPLNAHALLTAVTYYAYVDDEEEINKLLAVLNEVHPNNPLVYYYNALNKDVSKHDCELWFKCLDDELRLEYLRLLVNKMIKSKFDYCDFYILRAALVFYESFELVKLLENSIIVHHPKYKELLIWGLESPYIGIENKAIILEKFMLLRNVDKRIFVIPTELGVHCANIKNIDFFDDLYKEKLLASVGANLFFLVDEIDKRTLLKIVDRVLPVAEGFDSISLIKATVHYLYLLKKSDNPQMELVAGLYQVDLIKLEKYVTFYSK